MGGDEVRNLDRVLDSCWRIARESSELAYILDSEGFRKTEIGGDGNSLE